MKLRKLLTISLLASSALAYQPTQTDLQTALGTASGLWGMWTEVKVIQFGDLGPCNGGSDLSAITIFVSRSILLNRACNWSRSLLLITITHEYGHMLAGTTEHSKNKHSVMYWKLRNGQSVMQADLRRVRTEIEERKLRPSILVGGKD